MADPASVSVRDYGSFWQCLRDASFQSVSILTSTGYASTDYQNWPKPALFLLILCMFVGGCTGSTAGGLKILRLLVCVKLVRFTLRRFIRPRAIQKLKVDGEPIEDAIVTGILAVLLLWLIGVALGALALSLDPRLDVLSSVTASISMMGCTGPAMSEVVANLDGTFSLVNSAGINFGPHGGYGDLLPWSKFILAIQMILGRLEILAPLVLFAPAFWRR